MRTGAVFPIVTWPGRRARARLDRWQRRRERILPPRLLRAAARIVASVRQRGDRALLEAVERFDGVRVERVQDLRFVPPGVKEAAARVEPEFREAFEDAFSRSLAFHLAQREALLPVQVTGPGFSTEERRVPCERVGLYLPGGRASYPSTLLMGVAVTRAAGVRELVVACPLQTLLGDRRLAWALARLEVTEIWGLGGAHAVAALAHGTETISPVDFVFGPGNAWVTAGKALVAGQVGIDGLMGPSEVVIVAAGPVSASWMALDLLAQAEHDPQAGALLVTWDVALARRVRKRVLEALAQERPESPAGEALSRFGGAILVRDLEEARELVERLAPEHLQLVGEPVEAEADRFGPAGAVFVGAWTPEVFGDYLAGPNHILPTCGAARFSSPVGVETFLRRYHRIEVRETALAGKWARAAEVFARGEGLTAHARAASVRASEPREPRR